MHDVDLELQNESSSNVHMQIESPYMTSFMMAIVIFFISVTMSKIFIVVMCMTLTLTIRMAKVTCKYGFLNPTQGLIFHNRSNCILSGTISKIFMVKMRVILTLSLEFDKVNENILIDCSQTTYYLIAIAIFFRSVIISNTLIVEMCMTLTSTFRMTFRRSNVKMQIKRPDMTCYLIAIVIAILSVIISKIFFTVEMCATLLTLSNGPRFNVNMRTESQNITPLHC